MALFLLPPRTQKTENFLPRCSSTRPKKSSCSLRASTVAIAQYYGTASIDSEPPPIPENETGAPPPMPQEALLVDDDDFIISFEDESTPPTNVSDPAVEDLSDLLVEALDDDDETSKPGTMVDALTPPQGYSIPDASEENDEDLASSDAVSGFEPDFSSTTNAEIENIEQELSDLMQDSDNFADSFNDNATPPAGTDLGDMDDALSLFRGRRG